ncbi:hypothetical protein D3C77_732670 [compost metagenome]
MQVRNLLLQLGNGLAFALDAFAANTCERIQHLIGGVLDVEPAALDQTEIFTNFGGALTHCLGIGTLG